MIDINKVKREEGVWRTLLRQRYLQLMVLPGIVWMFIFNYLPMYGITIAFKNFKITKPISAAPWVGLEYFKEFINDAAFWNVMRNTLGISLLKLVIGFPIPIIFAILLNEMAFPRFKKLTQTVSYLPHFLSWVILGGILTIWLSDVGLINELLVRFRFIREPIVFLADPKYFWWLALISDTWKEMGWSAIIYLAAIAGVDQEMYEAATVDGAGKLRKIWSITLPAISGTIVVMFILAVGGLLNSNFDQIMVLKNSLNVSAAEVLDTYVYQMGIRSGRYSYATAVGLFKSVFAAGLLLGANAFTKKLNGRTLF